MKKSVVMMAITAFLFSMNVSAQEPIQRKKEKAKKECAVDGKKCCSAEAKKGCCSEEASPRKSRNRDKKV